MARVFLFRERWPRTHVRGYGWDGWESRLDTLAGAGLILHVIATKPKVTARKKGMGRLWTFEEMQAELPESNRPTELWDGELLMSPAPSFFHQLIDKRDLYEQHGVREYWLIDPEAQTMEVLHLDSGEYQLVGRWRPGERAHSRLLNGFEVAVTELLGAEPG
jgi:hypothetical protein